MHSTFMYLKIKPLAMLVSVIIGSNVQLVVRLGDSNSLSKVSTFKTRLES